MSGDGSTYAPKSPDLSSFYSSSSGPTTSTNDRITAGATQAQGTPQQQQQRSTYFPTPPPVHAPHTATIGNQQRRQSFTGAQRLAQQPPALSSQRSIYYATPYHTSPGGPTQATTPITPSDYHRNQTLAPASPSPQSTKHKSASFYGQPAYGAQYQPQQQQQPPVHPSQFYGGSIPPPPPPPPPPQLPAASAPPPHSLSFPSGAAPGIAYPGAETSQPTLSAINTSPMPPRRGLAAEQAAAAAMIEPSPVKTKFPTARIKRIMQADEEVGKVAQQTPIAVGKALEMFMVALVTKSAEVAREKNSKRVSAQMLKHVIESDEQWDFLRDIAGKIEAEEKTVGKGGRGKAAGPGAAAAAGGGESESEEEVMPEKKRRGGRKKKGT